MFCYGFGFIPGRRSTLKIPMYLQMRKAYIENCGRGLGFFLDQNREEVIDAFMKGCGIDRKRAVGEYRILLEESTSIGREPLRHVEGRASIKYGRAIHTRNL